MRNIQKDILESHKLVQMKIPDWLLTVQYLLNISD